MRERNPPRDLHPRRVKAFVRTARALAVDHEIYGPVPKHLVIAATRYLKFEDKKLKAQSNAFKNRERRTARERRAMKRWWTRLSPITRTIATYSMMMPLTIALGRYTMGR